MYVATEHGLFQTAQREKNSFCAYALTYRQNCFSQISTVTLLPRYSTVIFSFHLLFLSQVTDIFIWVSWKRKTNWQKCPAWTIRITRIYVLVTTSVSIKTLKMPPELRNQLAGLRPLGVLSVVRPFSGRWQQTFCWHRIDSSQRTLLFFGCHASGVTDSFEVKCVFELMSVITVFKI